MNETPSDITLMLQVKRGDESAFALLHRRYQQKVIAFFWGLSHDAQQANDLCQETFLRIWMVRKRYRAVASFPGYLFGIARMIWLERYRRMQRESRLGRPCTLDCLEYDLEHATRPNQDDPAASHELTQSFWKALEQLPEEQRMVFVMRNIEGLALGDIAAALDCPLNTVRSRKMLAVNKLRNLLHDVYATLVGDEATTSGGKW